MWTQMRTTPARNVGRERDVAVQALEGVHGMLLEVGKGGDRARFRSGRGRGLTDDSRDLGCGYGGKNLVRIALELCPCRAVATPQVWKFGDALLAILASLGLCLGVLQ